MNSLNFYIIHFFTCVWIINCDWVEIPHITKNSHSYPEEHFETIFLTAKPTYATVATTATPKIIYSKQSFSDVLERPPPIRNQSISKPHKRKDDTPHPRTNTKLVEHEANIKNPLKPAFSSKRRLHKTDGTNTKKSDFESLEGNATNESDYVEEYDDDSEEYSDLHDDAENRSDGKAKPSKNDTSYADFFPLLRTIQDSLITTSQKSTVGKITLLQNLRDNLLYNLKEKITNLWAPARDRRDAREHKHEYQMDNSHSEGPLMTIGFLTFAVFLIKLVLQLINALKGTQNVVVIPATTTTTTAATLIIGRRKRSEDINNMSSEILNLIEKFKIKNYNT